MKPLDYALKYAARGWRVFPVYECRATGTQCSCGNRRCDSPGKHPRTEHGLTDATTDAAQIRAWWRQWPNANIGIATGAGLVVVDIDPHHGGSESLDALREELGAWPDTVECLTGGSGRHIYFYDPSGAKVRNSVGTLAAGVDVRGEGGYVVAPPSIHASGRCYAWEASSDPLDGVAVAEIPAAWLARIVAPTRTPAPIIQPGAMIPDGQRNTTLFALGCSMRAKGAGDGAIMAALLAHNAEACAPPLTDDEVRGIAESATRYPPTLSPDYAAAAAKAAAMRAKRTPPAPLEAPPTVAEGAPDGSLEAVPAAPPRTLPQVEAGHDESRVADEAIAALASHPAVYQRGGALVHVLYDHAPLRGVTRPVGAPRIALLPAPTLRECIATVVQFYATRKTGPKPVAVPGTCVQAVGARGQWQGIRALEAVVECPMLRPDGTVVEADGYDPATGLLYAPTRAFPPVPDAPTQADASAAVARLLDVVRDFPFRAPEHGAAWLAAVLTILGRHAFEGCVPLFLFDANTAGAGKGLLTRVLGLITTGRPISVMGYSDDPIEQRKVITSLAIAGERLVLLDNVDRPLGGSALDAALTATEWSDRALGTNITVKVPLAITWLATGNNVTLKGDMARRVLHIRLESPEARPEERAGFHHADLEGYVREHRGALVAAALTVLRAYVLAGRPRALLTPWGSFQGWSELVRGALVWAGAPDPATTREELRSSADTQGAALAMLHDGWAEVAGAVGGGGCTAAEACEALEGNPRKFTALRAALAEMLPPGAKVTDPRAVGFLLRSVRGRIVGGRALVWAAGSDRMGKRWCVENTHMSPRGDEVMEVITPTPREIEVN